MVDHPQPVLVYHRIEANRRNTRLLMVAFFVLLLPLTAALAQVIGSPPFAIVATVVMAAIGVGQVIVLSSSILLKHVRATKIGRAEHQDLWRRVENLCIGAGLPMPQLYLIRSDAANAFALGDEPAQASLVITSGLLSLLSPRELTAVIAHELSHIGNRDTRLGTILAATLATFRLPWTGGAALLRLCFRVSITGLILIVVLWVLLGILSGFPGLVFVAFLNYLGLPLDSFLDAARFEVATLMRLTAPHVRTIAFTVAYVLFGAPWVATFLRQMISREREFLADADAVLLTRDPEGLALALAKVGGSGIRAGAATAHLYFVDPLPEASSSGYHPQIGERIRRIIPMSVGIPPENLDAAERIGHEYEQRLYTMEILKQGEPLALLGASVRACTKFRLTSGDTPLYESAASSSKVIAWLPADAIVKVPDTGMVFVRVTTDSGSGYIAGDTLALARPSLTEDYDIGSHWTGFVWPQFAEPLALQLLGWARAVAGMKFSLRCSDTPLYERPDGSSKVIERLPAGAIVTVLDNGIEGVFVRVTTDGNSGYLAAGTLAQPWLVEQPADVGHPASVRNTTGSHL